MIISLCSLYYKGYVFYDGRGPITYSNETERGNYSPAAGEIMCAQKVQKVTICLSHLESLIFIMGPANWTFL